ncbi:protein disulfide-isomerase A6 homolog [Onthophagus taurus]|uniref:protein disulfide-isomerase A6 homolog n=1 Tax=Onthophagus taurus TaxID=166361 RepID=UPI000C20BFD2|nr:protein disulfide-isomerase A6 homolog [Onthophagus taurus]
MWKHFSFIIATLLIQTGIGTFTAEQNVVDLKEQDFDFAVGRGHEVWALFFYIPYNTHSENAIPAFKQAAKRMLGLAKFGSVNVDRYPILAHRFDIRKIPTMVVIDKDSEEIKYTGKMNATAIIDFIGAFLMRKVQYGKQKRLSDHKLVKELTDDEMIKNGKNGSTFWLIAFYDSKDNVTLVDYIKMIEYAAESLDDLVSVGAFDITKRSTPYNYDGIPTVVLFYGKRYDRYEVEYNGTTYGNKLVDFVLSKVKKPRIKELWTETLLTEVCQFKKYCLITFIPVYEKCNRECKEKTKSLIQDVANNFKTISAGWVLIRQGVMKMAEKLLDISPTNYPIFVAVEVKTLKTAHLTEKYNPDNINKMILDILSDGFTGRPIPLFDHLPDYRPWKRDEL